MADYSLLDLGVTKGAKDQRISLRSYVSNEDKRAKLMKRAEQAASRLELQIMSNVVTDSVIRLSSKTNRSFLFVRDWDTNEMYLSSINCESPSHGDSPLRLCEGEGAAGIVLRSKKLLTANTPEEVRAIEETLSHAKRSSQVVREGQAQALLCCPIVVYQEVVAAFLLESTENGRRFNDEDVKFFERLCTSIASSIANTVLTDELSIEKNRLRLVVDQVLNAQEDERIRIARDLHDNTGQLLSLAALRAASCMNLASEDGAAMQRELGALHAELKAALQSLRDCIWDLRPPVLSSYGLAACIDDYVAQCNKKTDIDVRLLVEPALPELPERQSLIAFRIVQEAVGNAIRHSNAENVLVSLYASEDHLIIEIEDDGDGFDVDGALEDSGGFGLGGMIERATLVNGALSIRSKPSQGASVLIMIPTDQQGEWKNDK